jgi:hypothetical protein
MFEPEYRVGLRVLREKIGTWSTLKVVIPAIFKLHSNISAATIRK